MLWMFFLHSAAYWLCMPVRACIMISSFSGVKRYFVKRKNILLCLDKKTWRCGQRFGGLKPMLRSAAAICAPEPTRNVNLRRRHRPRESQRKSSTLWFTILRCYSMITQDEIYHRGSKDTRFFSPKQHQQNRDSLLHRYAVHNLACNAKQTVGSFRLLVLNINPERVDVGVPAVPSKGPQPLNVATQPLGSAGSGSNHPVQLDSRRPRLNELVKPSSR